jgi:hypothetical protein
LILEQQGVQGISDTNVIRNVFGDVVEDILMFVLYAAGVPIVAEQELVSLELAGVEISGTLDLVIDFGNDPKVWDIKSVSDWAFKNKFNKSFEDFIKEDYFGYADQLFFYSTARGCRVGGWIVKNKSDGQIKVIEAPSEQESLRDLALRRMEEKVNILLQDANQRVEPANSAQRFQPVSEFFRKKPTGNLIAHDACTFCDKKFHCWPGIQLKPRAKSEAKNPPLIWYTEYKE